MKKMLKRTVICTLILLILFDYMFYDVTFAMTEGEFVNGTINLIGGLVSFIIWIPKLLATCAFWLLNRIVTTNIADYCGINPAFTGPNGGAITPFEIFFNKYLLLDVNFFNLNVSSPTIKTMRQTVASWFYIVRTFSAAILLVVLIYVGIKMAISTIASDKARYKQMLWDWVASLVLIFVLQYICIFTIYANNAIVNLLRQAFEANGLADSVNKIFKEAAFYLGLNSIMAFFVYIMIIMQTFFFLIAYINRMLKVGFLIIISPLISVTYAIDKMGDGKAQALNAWLKEFIYTIVIQPFHCIMYITFVNAAVHILSTKGFADYNAIANGFMAILCLKFVTDGEKVVRKIFNFQDDSSGTSVVAGAALGMAAVSNAKKIGAGTRKAINTAKNSKITQKFSSAVKTDIAKNPNGAVARIANKASSAANAISNSKPFQLASNAKNKVISGATTLKGKFKGSKAGKFIKDHGKLMSNLGGLTRASTAAVMGMAMAAANYSTGQSGLMDSFAMGSAMYSGSKAFMETSSRRTENDISRQNDQADRFEKDAAYNAGREVGEKLGDEVGSFDDYAEGRRDTSELDEKISETDDEIQKLGGTEESINKDYADKKKNLERAQAQLKEAQNNKNAKKGDKKKGAKKLSDAQAKVRKCQSEFNKAEKRKNKLDELKEKKQNLQTMKEKAEEIKNFDNPENVKARMIDRLMEGKPTEDMMNEARNRILALIVSAKREEKHLEEGQDLSYEDQESILSEFDMAQAYLGLAGKNYDDPSAAIDKVMENISYRGQDQSQMRYELAQLGSLMCKQTMASGVAMNSAMGKNSAETINSLSKR